MSEHEAHEEICPDCHAGPDNSDTRIVKVHKDDAGGYRVVETWHSDDCPQYTVEQIMLEEGVRRAKEQEAWVAEVLPAAFERLRRAAAVIPEGDAAAPFAAALIALAGEQVEDTDRHLPPYRWAEVLTQYFPPENATPVRPDEEPTA